MRQTETACSWLDFFPRFSRSSSTPGLCWLQWRRGQPITSSTLMTTQWSRCGSLWNIGRTLSRTNVTLSTFSRECPVVKCKTLFSAFRVFVWMRHLLSHLLSPFIIRGNRFHSSWGGASYMGGVCSLTKGGGVNEVCHVSTILLYFIHVTVF